MHTIQPSALLKFALVADAIVSGAVALLQLTLAGPLAQLLALPHPLLAYTGEFLLAYTLLLVLMARARRLPRALVLLPVVGNVGWAIGCAELLIGGAVQANGLGVAFVLVQAVAVLVFAALEYSGLKRSTPAPADQGRGTQALHH
ncbi:MAG: hypothetical protein ACLGI6_02720 [Gammaproteobacteria bacterium]